MSRGWSLHDADMAVQWSQTFRVLGWAPRFTVVTDNRVGIRFGAPSRSLFRAEIYENCESTHEKEEKEMATDLRCPLFLF